LIRFSIINELFVAEFPPKEKNPELI